jgi:hypothetical protein
LEFDTATAASMDRLMFLLNTDAADVGIPPIKLIDREYGDRQDAFRHRVADGGYQRLRTIYHAHTPAGPRRTAEDVIASFSSCPVPEVARLGRTLRAGRPGSWPTSPPTA